VGVDPGFSCEKIAEMSYGTGANKINPAGILNLTSMEKFCHCKYLRHFAFPIGTHKMSIQSWISWNHRKDSNGKPPPINVWRGTTIVFFTTDFSKEAQLMKDIVQTNLSKVAVSLSVLIIMSY
jgi:hypothetical protein